MTADWTVRHLCCHLGTCDGNHPASPETASTAYDGDWGLIGEQRRETRATDWLDGIEADRHADREERRRGA